MLSFSSTGKIRNADAPTCKPSNPILTRNATISLLLFSSAITLGHLFVSSDPYNLDETIYILMAEFAREGRLSIDNGYALHPSEALKLLVLRAGPLGLVPQYPSGFGFIASPFYTLAGQRGLVALNTVAYFAAMFLTYRIARRSNASSNTSIAATAIFSFATFAINYAYGIWPHSISVAIVLVSTLCILISIESETSKGKFTPAFIGGLFMGIGLLFRVDLILCAYPTLVFLTANRDRWPAISPYVVGCFPGLLISSFVNRLKFGTWIPIHYGDSGGAQAISGYWPLLIGSTLPLVLAVYFSTRKTAWTITGPWALASALICVALILMVDPLRENIVKLAVGFYALVVDFQSFPVRDPLPYGLSYDKGGHLLVHGHLKRALLQSLPFLGVLPITLHTAIRQKQAILWLFFLIIFCWILPFAYRQWHGGSALHMRYLLPTLPFLSIMTATAITKLLSEFQERRDLAQLIFFTFAISLIFTLIIFFLALRGSPVAMALASKGSLALAAATAIGTLLFIGSRTAWRRFAARTTLVLALAGVAWAGASNLVYDFAINQVIRNLNGHANVRAKSIPDDSLVVIRRAVTHLPQLLRENSYVGVYLPSLNHPKVLKDDVQNLAIFHLSSGRRVFVEKEIVRELFGAVDNVTYGMPPANVVSENLVELSRAGP